MIARLLIANRGEIAVRIARACRELGIESIAVYSEADQSAVHVDAADRAVCIGPAPVESSYLSAAGILDAARASGADAVHPGYGFLSENADFARACARAGLIFVGPPPEAIALLGSKVESRAAVAAAGVPIVPGEVPSDQSDVGLRRAIERVGFPALVKASAGGGGRGMRQVTAVDEIEAAVQSARREALAAFGDGTLYVERLLTSAHHVEVQIFGDAHDQIVHLFERDCSLQRRHQKVIEESPSPALDGRLREHLTLAAVKAARAAGYRNAGTVEFLVESGNAADDGRAFYFLEMNTRLQVEHPVTEAIAGVDLVRAQLLVAAGEPLPWRQEALVQRGHAIEARVYAEDPAQGFLPQSGRLLVYREPAGPGIRVDAGVREGDVVSPYYDPLLAKVIASAETRALATARLAAALRRYAILGVRTNLSLLVRVLEHPAFSNGTATTAWLDERAATLVAEAQHEEWPAPVREAIAAHGAASSNNRPGDRRGDPWDTL
jgi:acetyl-CoA carboxylase biotin carboxylase subunit